VGGANFLTILLIGRLAGPHELGEFALAMTAYYLLLAVQDSLITAPYTLLVVRLTGVRQRQYSAAALCQSAALSACVGAILAIVALSLFLLREETSVASVAAAFALATPLLLLREFGRRFLFAHMQVARVVAMSIVGSTAQLIVLGVMAYYGKLSTTTALLAIAVGSGISGFGRLWLSRAGFHFNHRRWSYFLYKNWDMGRWLLPCQAMGIFAENTMPWMIWIWLGPTATGLFAACDWLIRFSNPVFMSLNNVFTPRVARGLNDGGKVELNRIVWKATALLSLFLCAFCIGLAIAGEWILNRLFGKTYEGFSATLVVLGINQLVGRFGLGFAPSVALWVLQRANLTLFALAAGLAASLLVAPLLLAHYGSLGAALALLTGSLVYSAVTIAFYRAQIRDPTKESFTAIGPAVRSAAPTGSVFE
jgi:O-antigen/teichoic acid export membrane protein